MHVGLREQSEVPSTSVFAYLESIIHALVVTVDEQHLQLYLQFQHLAVRILEPENRFRLSEVAAHVIHNIFKTTSRIPDRHASSDDNEADAFFRTLSNEPESSVSNIAFDTHQGSI
jgi:hypothetical protein